MKFKDFTEKLKEGSGDVEYSSDYKLSQSGRKVKARRLEFKNGEDDREKNVRNESSEICKTCESDPCICDDSHGFVKEEAPVAPSIMKHRISVTVSDPDHQMVSMRKEKIQKTVIVKHSSNKEGAQKVGEKFYKKKGYIVHDSHHAGMVNEEVVSEESDAYAKSEENKRSADAAKKQGDMFAHHLHMSDYHDNLAQWHGEKGRHGTADSHAEKSEQHHEMAMKLKLKKEETELLEYEIHHDGNGNYRDDEGNEWNSRTGSAHRSSFGRRHTITSDVPHAVHINGKKWKTFGSQSHAQNVANKIKGATVHKEEVELDEKLNPSMGAGEYIKDFQKSDAPQFKGKSKEKRRMMGIAAYMAAKKGMKEEVEQIEEATVKTQKYSWGTMKTVHHGSDFSIPLHPEHHQAIAKLKDQQEHHFKDETGRHWTARRKGDDVHFQGANGGDSTKVKHSTMSEELKGDQHKLDKNKNGKLDAQDFKKLRKEENIEEAFINGREYASHGLMHPDHAKMAIHQKTGKHVDFYASKTGDKMQGVVTKNDGKSVHIQAHKDKELGDGKLHKFKVTPHLPKQQNEGNDMVTYKDFIAQLNEYEVDKNGRYVHKGSYGSSYQGDDEDDDEKPKKPAGEKRGRGRPAGSGSGARQKGSGSGKSYGGIATHSLNLPSSK